MSASMGSRGMLYSPTVSVSLIFVLSALCWWVLWKEVHENSFVGFGNFT